MINEYSEDTVMIIHHQGRWWVNTGKSEKPNIGKTELFVSNDKDKAISWAMNFAKNGKNIEMYDAIGRMPYGIKYKPYKKKVLFSKTTNESKIKKIIKEEIQNVKWGTTPLNEDIVDEDEERIREIIRSEVAAIFFSLFKKRKQWGA